MRTARRTELRNCIIGYANIGAIILGITCLRLNFPEQRIDRPRLLRLYVFSVNLLTILLVPFAYVLEAAQLPQGYNHNLSMLTDGMTMLITFSAVIITVLLRRKHETLYVDIAEALFQLEKDYFSKLRIDNAVEQRSDYLLFFKVFVFAAHTIAPFYGALVFSPTASWLNMFASFYYGFVYNLLFGTLFVYFYLMWLLRKRFSLLNTKLSDLLHSIQIWLEADNGFMQLQKLGVCGAEEIMMISKIHERLSTLTERLNADFKLQILAGLLTQLLNCICYGYYGFLLNEGFLKIKVSTPMGVLGVMFTVIMFVDGYLLYWITDTTARSYQRAAQLLSRFPLIQILCVEFEQQVCI